MSGMKTLQRCRNAIAPDNVVVIDVDSEHFDSVIIIDVPAPLPKKWQSSSMVRKKEKWPSRTVICIDDDESTDSDHSGLGVNENGSFSSGASPSKISSPASKNFESSAVAASKECQFDNGQSGIRDHDSASSVLNDDHHPNVRTESKNGQHKEPPFCSSTGKASHGNEAPSPFITEEDTNFDSSSYGYSKSDGHKRSHSDAKDPNYTGQKDGQHYEPVSPSCQNEESLNSAASSYFPYHGQGTEQVDCPTMAFQDDEGTPTNYFHGKPSLVEEEASMCKHQNSYETYGDNVRFTLKDGEKKLQETFTASEQANVGVSPSGDKVGPVPGEVAFCKNSSLGSEDGIDNCYHQETRKAVSETPSFCNVLEENSSVEAVETLVESVSKSMHKDEDDQKHMQNGGTALGVENFIINEREKLKETDEYKRALEVEWASRQQALKIQAEEAQHLRQSRKRKKAESMRLQDMAKRQKQRVKEIRETQEKDVENLNLKEVMRSQVRKELKKLEMTCCNMASLLHSLGIPVGSWPCPSPNEVQTAYKRALLKFHPDRASKSDIRQQVEAEEKFKLINRLKEKLLPSS
ncbi:unnamed protein product [Fraxinus pennsylvanica]|uniref:J domain-containing protein n=1 Tax=Fraxinus pennsylvanica TaxID=56036 RepID=A0AAD2A1N1_9LAMI|nr:unnamed protein product [Fraxinus pennsylvanica]